MFNFKQAYNDIQEVKQKVNGMDFEDACRFLGGYNSDNELCDFDWGCIAGTIYNENGKAKTSETCLYSIYSDEWETEEPLDLTEQEIYERSKNDKQNV